MRCMVGDGWCGLPIRVFLVLFQQRVLGIVVVRGMVYGCRREMKFWDFENRELKTGQSTSLRAFDLIRAPAKEDKQKIQG